MCKSSDCDVTKGLAGWIVAVIIISIIVVIVIPVAVVVYYCCCTVRAAASAIHPVQSIIVSQPATTGAIVPANQHQPYIVQGPPMYTYYSQPHPNQPLPYQPASTMAVTGQTDVPQY